MIALRDGVLAVFGLDRSRGSTIVGHRPGELTASGMGCLSGQNLRYRSSVTRCVGVIRTGAFQRISLLVMKGHTGEHLVLSNCISGQINQDLAAEDNLTVRHIQFSLRYSDAI